MTRFATRLLRLAAAPGDPHAPVSTPLYQTATFEQPDADELGRYDYTRSGNPTRTVLEELLAELEGGHRAFAFASGMAAVSAVVRLVEAGGAIVAGDDLYCASYRLLASAAGVRCGRLRGRGPSCGHDRPSEVRTWKGASETFTGLKCSGPSAR